MIATFCARSEERARPRAYSALGDCEDSTESWMTGMVASGAMRERGMKTPWSQPDMKG